MMSSKKKYFPNNIRSIQSAPSEYFEAIEFEEMLEWRVCSWELPDTIAAVIRCENSKTGKVTEHIYQQYKSAQNKIEKLISDPNNTLTIATQNAIGQTSYELHSLLDN